MGTFHYRTFHPESILFQRGTLGVNKFLEKPVVVQSGQALNVNIEFQPSQGRRSVHEMAENSRFGLELLGEGVEILPSLQVQKA